MRVLHLDSNHPLLIQQLEQAGFSNTEAYTTPKQEILKQINDFDGLVIRSRFRLDREFLDAASGLKFIARVGAGMENIDTEYAESKGIQLISAPEGNRSAVGEHALGMLLSLFNNMRRADNEVRSGQWRREANRGTELDGKIVGLIGYGNMGKAFAKKMKGFNCTTLCYDIKADVGNKNATQVSLKTLREMADVLSIHTPLTPETRKMVNTEFIESFKKPFWFINTARGACVETADLVTALKSGKVLGAGLDVLEYEDSSFESLFDGNQIPEPLKELVTMDQVILSPHVAGWTIESKEKLAQTVVDKILKDFT